MPGHKMYKQKFRNDWLRHDLFKSWLMKVGESERPGHCKFCKCNVNSKFSALIAHMKSKKHGKHVKATLVRPVSIKEYYDHEFIKSDLANPPQVKISSDTRLTVSLKHFQPLFDRVLVQRAVPVKQTKVSIHIPEANQTNKFIATVVAVGPGARGENGKNIPPAVQVGDVVFLPEFGGTKVILEEKEYFLYRDSDFLAKIKPVA